MAAISLASCTLDVTARRLACGGREVDVRPQAMEMLCLLASRPNTLVTKEELFKALWPGLVVTDDSLVQAVGDIRRALGDADHRIVATVPKRGYRLNIAASPGDPPQASAAASASPPESSAPRARALPTSPVRGWQGVSLFALAAGCIAAAVGIVKWLDPAHAPHWLPGTDRAPVAVLPFTAAGSGQDAALLGQGMAVDLTTALARNSDVRVIMPLSVRVATQQQADTDAVVRALGVRYFVDGNVERVGARLRLTVRFNDSAEHRVLWSDQQDVDVAGLAMVRDAFVQRVAMELHSSLRTAEVERVSLRPPASLDVYEKTLRAVALKHQQTPESIASARHLLQEVTQADENYAPGWAYLAMVNMTDRNQRLSDPSQIPGTDIIDAQLNRALQLDPGLPVAHVTRAMLKGYLGHPDEALAAVDACIEHAPSDADCRMVRVQLLTTQGRSEEALRELDAHMALVPVGPTYIYGIIARTQVIGRRYQDGLATAEKCLARSPKYVPCHVTRVLALVEGGSPQEARTAAQEMLERVPVARLRAVYGVGPPPSEARARVSNALKAAGVPLELEQGK